MRVAPLVTAAALLATAAIVSPSPPSNVPLRPQAN
jgi:hypothetical protein